MKLTDEESKHLELTIESVVVGAFKIEALGLSTTIADAVEGYLESIGHD